MSEKELSTIMEQVRENVSQIESICDTVVSSYTSPLDEVMKKIYISIQSKDITTDVLELYCMELSNTLYFMGSNLESLGIRQDISKAMYKEVYNSAYLGNQIKDGDKRNKTTVAENQAHADECSKQEATVSAIYERAYKQVKYKIDSGHEMVGTLRKIITKRIQEMQLSSMQPRTNYGFRGDEEDA